VSVVEPLGTEAFVHLERGGRELVARFESRSAPRSGVDAEFAVVAALVHVFDASSEEAIAHVDLASEAIASL
jgi:multiple sugar transport system ATP-binding protein